MNFAQSQKEEAGKELRDRARQGAAPEPPGMDLRRVTNLLSCLFPRTEVTASNHGAISSDSFAMPGITR